MKGFADLSLRRLRKSEYVRSTAINTVGLLMSSAVPILSSPILARLYLPSDFGQFGLYAAIVGLGTLTVTGRYEVAVIVPGREIEAIEVAIGAAAATFLFSAVALTVVLLFNWLAPGSIPLEHGLVLLAPLAMLVAGWGQIAVNYAIRQKAFRLMSISRSMAAITGAAVAITLGVERYASWGLALGVFANQLLLTLLLGRPLVQAVLAERRAIEFKAIRARLVRYRNYPIYSLPSDLANTLATSLPVMVFSACFGATATGYLVMFQRVWSASSILGKGLGETFRQKAAADYVRLGDFRQAFLATLWPLVGIAVVVWVCMVTIGPTVFGIVLGERWHEAGVYGQILATFVCIQFVASPLSWSAYIAERLKTNAVWQFALLVVCAGALALGVATRDERLALLLLSMSGALLYTFYIGAAFLMAAGRYPMGKS